MYQNLTYYGSLNPYQVKSDDEKNKQNMFDLFYYYWSCISAEE